MKAMVLNGIKSIFRDELSFLCDELSFLYLIKF